MMPGSKVPFVAIDEAVRAARRVLELQYPDEEYLPLVLVLPIRRQLVREAKGGNAVVDAMIRDSLRAIVDTVAWPEDMGS